MEQCPCGSDRPFSACCEPYLQMRALPVTAEQLMRSRYTAYVKGNINYIYETYHPSRRIGFDFDAARRWSNHSDWLGLEVLHVLEGGQEDTTGVVEFKACYCADGVVRKLQEISHFQRIGGKWFYVEGKYPAQ